MTKCKTLYRGNYVRSFFDLSLFVVAHLKTNKHASSQQQMNVVQKVENYMYMYNIIIFIKFFIVI